MTNYCNMSLFSQTFCHIFAEQLCWADGMHHSISTLMHLLILVKMACKTKNIINVYRIFNHIHNYIIATLGCLVYPFQWQCDVSDINIFSPKHCATKFGLSLVKDLKPTPSSFDQIITQERIPHLNHSYTHPHTHTHTYIYVYIYIYIYIYMICKAGIEMNTNFWVAYGLIKRLLGVCYFLTCINSLRML